MTPHLLLTILVSVTLLALVVGAIANQRRRERIQRLAAEWKLNFAVADTLQLCSRLADKLPVPGAATPRVSNLIYGIDGDLYRYYFTIDYTVGVTESKRRVWRVAAYVEPRDRRRGGTSTLTLANEELPLIEQYRSLREPGSGWPEFRPSKT